MNNRLDLQTLASFPPEVARPGYDRSAVGKGIVHLGLGAFHRAHQAVFIDDSLNRGEGEWGIVAASLRSPETRNALVGQDSLYTVVLRDGEGDTFRIIGSVLSVIVAPENPDALLDALTDPRVRIVTLTITEKGYTANIASQTLLADHPDVVHDLANPGAPRTALGFLTEAIRRRRAGSVAPFTVLTCDNLPSNGKTLRKLTAQFAAIKDPALARYIEMEMAFPSSMVDRIVPATSAGDRALVSSVLGVEDAWPVVAEPFFQWVIEDHFPQGRPRLEDSGVEFVADVEPFEHMKLRLLNGAHTTIAAIGQTTGLPTVADVFARQSVSRLIALYWRQVAATLDPAVDAVSYVDRLARRFLNPALRHLVTQIATDASQKLPQRILAPLAELHREKLPATAVAFATAVWIRSCYPFDERGAAIAMNDPVVKAWRDGYDFYAMPAARVVESFLTLGSVFGLEWVERVEIVKEITSALDLINRVGTLAAIERAFPQLA